MRAPDPPLDGCDRSPECISCTQPVCPYETPAQERQYRRRYHAAVQLLAAGWTPRQVVARVPLRLDFVEDLARKGARR